MKLSYTDGCICTSLTVDDVETVNMEMRDVKNVICKLVNSEKDLGTLQQVFCRLMESQGVYEDLGQCSCCGDYVDRYTLEI